LLEEAGQLLSRECEAKGAHVWLGPTVNIVRSPLNGRGFESFSEDPWLSGVLAAAIIRGVQSRGTLAALKHFVANDHEVEKMSIDVCLSDRALREVYLRPFQVALREASPRVVMSSYNKVQGTHVSESRKLLQGILRHEWGFDGLIMSDWYVLSVRFWYGSLLTILCRFGTYSCEAALNAGLDIEMPGPTRHRGAQAIAAVSSGKVYRHIIDERARSFLHFINDTASARVAPKETTRDVPEDRLLNRRLARESIVLLKNSSNVLPMNSEQCEDVAIIGPNAKLPASCGGGSASLTPYYTTSVFQGIQQALPKGTALHYEPGIFGHVLLPILTGDHVTNDAGEPGVSIELFNEPATVSDRRSFDYLSIPDTAYQLMDYEHPAKQDPFYMSMRATYVAEHSGPHEFGLATYGVGSLYINDELLIDNETQQSPGGMFFGKGSAEKRGVVNMCAGQTYRLRVEAGSASTSKVKGGSLIPIPGGACRLGGCVKIEPDEGIQRAAALASRCKRTFVIVGLNVSTPLPSH
jgi:beta-glucosidase